MEVPIEGFLEVPIKVFGQTLMASFFVKADVSLGAVGRRIGHPVLLGCNILRDIAKLSVEPVGPSSDDWKLVLQCLDLPATEIPVTCNELRSSVPPFACTDALISMDAVTIDSVEISHGEVIVVNCRVIGIDDKANHESVLIETSLDACSGLCVVEGIQQINGCMVEVVVGNPGPETITIPAATKLLTARAVSPTDRVVVCPVDGVLNVTV